MAEFEAEQHPIYVAGTFKTTSTLLNVFSPYTQQCAYQTFLAADEDYEAAVTAALSVRQTLQDLPVYERFRILNEISQGIGDNRGALAVTMAREAGKPLKTANDEIDRAVQTFLIAAEEAKRFPGEVLSIDWSHSGGNKDAIVKYFPAGIVAGITPFNFPLNLVAHKIAPAIAAGCPIVLKPASKTPITALLLARIIDAAGLPPGAVSVLPMDRSSGNKLVTDPRFKVLSFTGSAENGWTMKRQAGKKKVLLELGGNAALIVDKDADLNIAAAKAVSGAFSYAGQSCIHTQRIYVETSVFERFIELFQAGMAELVIGDPEHPDTDLSAMIEEHHAQRIESWVQEAVQAGAAILSGGTRQGALYAPTLLTGTGRNMKVCAQEAFAPLVLIERFSDFKEAVADVNASEFGLQAGVFTFDSRKIHYAFQHLHVGGVLVNEVPTFRADHMPYGGVKDSGLGREGPKYAMLEMLEPKILVHDYSQSL
ncbi:MAG: aldehyde dehydrogenase family protein [Gammaproteobacteria bacterium]